MIPDKHFVFSGTAVLRMGNFRDGGFERGAFSGEQKYNEQRILPLMSPWNLSPTPLCAAPEFLLYHYSSTHTFPLPRNFPRTKSGGNIRGLQFGITMIFVPCKKTSQKMESFKISLRFLWNNIIRSMNWLN